MSTLISSPVVDDDVLRSFSFLRATHNTALAAVVLLLYDYLTSLSDEQRYIWHSRWNMGKILYVLNRYIPTIDLTIHLNTFLTPNPSHSFCQHWFYIDVFLSWFSLAVLQTLFAMRTMALYPRSRSLRILLLSVFCLSMLSLFVLCVAICVRISVARFPPIFQVPGLSTGCVYSGDTDILGPIWLSPIVLDCVVCAITLRKAVDHFRSRTLPHSPLFFALYRDGFAYFLLIFSIALSNVLIWYLLPQSGGELIIMPYRAAMCVLGSRVLIGLRRAREELRHRVPKGEVTTVNDITRQSPWWDLTRWESWDVRTSEWWDDDIMSVSHTSVLEARPIQPSYNSLPKSYRHSWPRSNIPLPQDPVRSLSVHPSSSTLRSFEKPPLEQRSTNIARGRKLQKERPPTSSPSPLSRLSVLRISLSRSSTTRSHRANQQRAHSQNPDPYESPSAGSERSPPRFPLSAVSRHISSFTADSHALTDQQFLPDFSSQHRAFPYQPTKPDVDDIWDSTSAKGHSLNSKKPYNTQDKEEFSETSERSAATVEDGYGDPLLDSSLA